MLRELVANIPQHYMVETEYWIVLYAWYTCMYHLSGGTPKVPHSVPLSLSQLRPKQNEADRPQDCGAVGEAAKGHIHISRGRVLLQGTTS